MGIKAHIPFFAYMLSSMLVYAGVDAVLSLMSSVNIEDGLGTSSLAISYGTAIVPAFMIPGFIRKIGVKRMLIFASICYFFFVLGNIYSTKSMLVAAGVLNGIAESVGWTTSSLVNSYFARVRSITGTKAESVYSKHYFGYYWTATPFGSMLGNMVVFAILHYDRQDLALNYNEHGNASGANYTVPLAPPAAAVPVDVSVCGANDCQTEEAISSSLHQYQPVNDTTRTVFICTCALMIFVAVLLNIIFIPSDVDEVLRQKSLQQKLCPHGVNGDHSALKIRRRELDIICKSSTHVNLSNPDLFAVAPPVATSTTSAAPGATAAVVAAAKKSGSEATAATTSSKNLVDGDDDDGAVDPLVQIYQTSKGSGETASSESNSDAAMMEANRAAEHEKILASLESNTSLAAEVMTKFKLTVRLIFTWKQVLVMLLPIYNGLEVGFIFGEMTRAYSACVLGLDKVSVSIILFGIANAFSSLLAGHVAGRFGRNLPFLVGYLFDMSLYMVCLAWRQPDSEICIYILFLGFGYSEGMWATLVNEMYGDLFNDQTDVAYNLWGVLLNLGMMLQYAFSTSLCVYKKIYIMMALLTMAIAFYFTMLCIYFKRHKFLQGPTGSTTTHPCKCYTTPRNGNVANGGSQDQHRRREENDDGGGESAESGEVKRKLVDDHQPTTTTN